MDYYNMKRKKLQALCKKHKLPANSTNREMASRLSSLVTSEMPEIEVLSPIKPSGDNHFNSPIQDSTRKRNKSELVSEGTSVFDDVGNKEKKTRRDDVLYIPSVSDPPRCYIVSDDDASTDAADLFNLIIWKKSTEGTAAGLPPPTIVSGDYVRQTFTALKKFPDQDLLDSGFLLQIDTFDSFVTRMNSAPPPVHLPTGYGSVCASHSLCGFTIVIVSIERGLQRKITDIIRILQSTFSPFVVALTGINTIPGWRSCRRYTMTSLALSSQSLAVQHTYVGKALKLIKELEELCSLSKRLVGTRVEPIGAISGEGVGQLVFLLFGHYYKERRTARKLLLEKAAPSEIIVGKSPSMKVEAPIETTVGKWASSHAAKEANIEAPSETIVRKSATSQSVNESYVESCEGIRDRDSAGASLDLSMNDWRMECLMALVKYHVLPFLPAKYLLQLKKVSKDWHRWIAGLFLAYKQSVDFRSISGFFCQDCEGFSFMSLNDSLYGIPDPSLTFLPEEVVIRNSCNGLLLCQGKSGENVYYVCNPTNKEFDVLPLPTYFHGDEPKVVLAFEPVVGRFVADYKVICPIFVNEPTLYFEVYDSRARSWKCCCAGDGVNYDIAEMRDGFFSGGVVYWETLSRGYVGFDIRNEQCDVHPRPCESVTHGSFLSQINGRLCYIQPHHQHEVLCIDFIFGNDSTKASYSLSIPRELLPGLSEECEILPCGTADVLMIHSCEALYFYNIKHQEIELACRSEYRQSARYIPYVNSLFPLGCQQPSYR